MNYKQKVGRFGELLAQKFLKKHGYEIVDINVKLSYQEIDIIAQKKGITVFVEVKTRTSEILGRADDSFSHAKMKNFLKAVNKYINSRNIDGNYIQIDLIAVDIKKKTKTAKIRHYKEIL